MLFVVKMLTVLRFLGFVGRYFFNTPADQDNQNHSENAQIHGHTKIQHGFDLNDLVLCYSGKLYRLNPKTQQYFKEICDKLPKIKFLLSWQHASVLAVYFIWLSLISYGIDLYEV